MASEQYAFVFAVTYIILFAGLLSMIPVDLQGQGNTANINIPVDPTLTTGFSAYETFLKSDFTGVIGLIYTYDGVSNDMGYTFDCYFLSGTFHVGAHVLWFGIWLGATDWCIWTSGNGTVYDSVTFSDIDNDAVDGVVRYELTFSGSGKNAGGFIFYYNTTIYTDASDAWDNDVLNLVHGVGLTASTDTTNLLLALLFLQLPDVPIGFQLLINSPFYASIGYVIWFIIKEMIPFLG